MGFRRFLQLSRIFAVFAGQAEFPQNQDSARILLGFYEFFGISRGI